jgi:hypothetical protein
MDTGAAEDLKTRMPPGFQQINMIGSDFAFSEKQGKNFGEGKAPVPSMKIRGRYPSPTAVPLELKNLIMIGRQDRPVTHTNIQKLWMMKDSPSRQIEMIRKRQPRAR